MSLLIVIAGQVRVSPDMREGRRIVQMSGDEQQKASAIEMINQIVEATGEAGAEGAGVCLVSHAITHAVTIYSRYHTRTHLPI